MQTRTVWDILINCARKQQVISEKTLAGMLGIGREELQVTLEAISMHCREHNLLPLHALVVSESEADGEGGGAAHKNRLGQLYFWIFDYEWESLPSNVW